MEHFYCEVRMFHHRFNHIAIANKGYLLGTKMSESKYTFDSGFQRTSSQKLCLHSNTVASLDFDLEFPQALPRKKAIANAPMYVLPDIMMYP